MGNKIVTIVTTFIVMIAFMVLTAFISNDMQIDEAKKVVSNLVEEIQYKGYITNSQYMDAINSIPYKNIKLQITQFKQDKYNIYLPGTLDMVYTSQILGDVNDDGYIINKNGEEIISGTLLRNKDDNIESNGIYKFEIGDQVQIDLVVLESSMYDVLIGIFTGRGIPSIKILTSDSGVVVNEKWGGV